MQMRDQSSIEIADDAFADEGIEITLIDANETGADRRYHHQDDVGGESRLIVMRKRLVYDGKGQKRRSQPEQAVDKNSRDYLALHPPIGAKEPGDASEIGTALELLALGVVHARPHEINRWAAKHK